MHRAFVELVLFACKYAINNVSLNCLLASIICQLNLSERK